MCAINDFIILEEVTQDFRELTITTPNSQYMGRYLLFLLIKDKVLSLIMSHPKKS